MNQSTGGTWVVMKLGGTSVASRSCWGHVAEALAAHRRAGRRVMLVHSALSGVTDRLERLLRGDPAAREAQVAELLEHHRSVASDLGVAVDDRLAVWIQRLSDRLDGGDTKAPSCQADVLAFGELMATEISSAFLASKGVEAAAVDARDWLVAIDTPGQSPVSRYLSATCDDGPDAGMRRRLASVGDVVVTQGFIARDADGRTVVLGRGGSDTSAAYFAARLSAARLEIWTDVPGLFSANPNEVSGARLLRNLDYAEAQEIATTGARVLHPRCIGPARRNGIPIRIVYAPEPTLAGTTIGVAAADTGGRVKAVSVRHGVVLVSMETVGMWHQVGFLSDAFGIFKDHGLSIDMISTSETSVTVTLDPLVNPGAEAALDELLADLSAICRARTVVGCSAISLVGRHVRANLHRLGPALEVFEERQVHLVSQAANDLNLTFVVGQADAARLVKELHALLVRPAADETVLGPTWDELRAPPAPVAAAWWRARREELLALAGERSPVYVYERNALRAAVAELGALRNADRVFYAVKANCHPQVLAEFNQAGLGFECVSPGELEHVRRNLPGIDPDRFLFTPNFAPRGDYQAGMDAGVHVTLDNLHPLQAWPSLFRGREVFLRVDPGAGAGHHKHVRTAGRASKFGIPMDELPEARRLADDAGARVVGLHMHIGSGILDPDFWIDAGRRLAALAANWPDVRILDIGGGLGVRERPGDRPLDLAGFDHLLGDLKARAPGCELWIEPGRFLVARAGVLLTRVTQLKGKGEVRYAGVDTGMNSLIRPALYGAHHDIVNLTRLDEPAGGSFNVVGPICETGDVLGRERRLPEPREGDVLLIANAGAYGQVMASRYNLREAAEEIVV